MATLPAQSERSLDRVNASVRQIARDIGENYATLDSPALAGAPTAPTPDTASDDTSIATTAFVKAQGYALDADLDAHAGRTDNPHAVTKAQVGLGNADNTADADKPVSTATLAALNLKAPLASPALTGAPTVPTAAVGTSTTQAASTEFVVAEIENKRQWRSVYKTADTSIVSNNTLADDPDLQFPVVANGVYSFRLMVSIASGAGGVNLAINGPSSSRIRISAASSSLLSAYTAFNTSFGLSTSAAATTIAFANGTVTIGGTGGTFAVRIAQLNVNAAATLIEKGSVLDYIRIA